MPVNEAEQKPDSMYKFEVDFQGHYKEPNLTVAIPRSLIVENNNAIRIDMVYNPRKCIWEFVMSYNFASKQDLDIIQF